MVLKTAIAAAALCGATMLPASAMPINSLAGAETGNVEQVRWVCGYRGCWWQPAPRFYGGYGRRFGGNGRYWGSPYQQRSWSR